MTQREMVLEMVLDGHAGSERNTSPNPCPCSPSSSSIVFLSGEAWRAFVENSKASIKEYLKDRGEALASKSSELKKLLGQSWKAGLATDASMPAVLQHAEDR